MNLVDEVKPSGRVCVDLGSGTGVVGSHLVSQGYCQLAVLVDVVEDALISSRDTVEANNLSSRGIVITSVEALNDGSVDMVVSNPPYLPAYDPGKIDIATEGGVKGYETVAYFIRESSRILKQGGFLFLVYSSLTGEEAVESLLAENGFEKIKTTVSKFFYEEIKVVYCRRKGQAK
ncbi:methyltransferase [Thermosphaera chiliense]|uniref:methyltransferase n=1 Tax=Thermosphaera chiliense TaxID=3402707 RepID=UPI001D0ADDC2|nr:methyltransferase [Thermosphaera aggregans]